MSKSSSAPNMPSTQEVLQRCKSGEASAPETPSQHARRLLERMSQTKKTAPARVTEAGRARASTGHPATARDLPAEMPAPIPPSRLAQRLVERVRGNKKNPLERFAELIRDVLIDWDFMDERDEAAPPPDELPLLSPEAFVYALRQPLDETLRQVAEAINAAPTGNLIGGSEEQVCQLLAAFWAQALECGVQMRLEAAEATQPPGVRANGEWARRLRQMLVGGADMPLR